MLTAKTPNISTPRMDWGILFLLFFLAWGLRVIGLDWGYLHGDERVNQAAKVLAGELIPDQHFYPPLMHYMAAVLFGVLYVVGRGLDLWANTGEFRAQYFQDPTLFYLVARAMTGALSALLAPLFYRIGRLLGFGKGESFVIALFAVFAPLSVYLSYIFKGDVGMAAASVWIILLMIRKVQTPDLKRIDIALGIAVVSGAEFQAFLRAANAAFGTGLYLCDERSDRVQIDHGVDPSDLCNRSDLMAAIEHWYPVGF